MKIEDVLNEMRDSVGKKDPIIYFEKLIDALSVLNSKIENISANNLSLKNSLALAINWDPRVASALLAAQISELRQNKDIYFNEISLLKDAYAKNIVTQNPKDFCEFWQDTLGWHPFLGA